MPSTVAPASFSRWTYRYIPGGKCGDRNTTFTRESVPDGTLGDVHLDRDEALRRASLVPACYAIDGDRLAIPIDAVKPKGSTALGRVRNLERDPRAALLVE